MNKSELEGVINVAWENRDEINSGTQGEIRKAVEQALNAMDSGELRVAEKTGGTRTTLPPVQAGRGIASVAPNHPAK